ncbi:MAG: OB-fold domain-containing protein [Microthrixaceae bacterium]|nr:OB-fold domain-containing protein [Microthrixaceae bacterium]MCO5320337.1 OB-fold domain-containing protein [Microthrixaceae bacterium]
MAESDMEDRSTSTMPGGLWTQPSVSVPDIGDGEVIQRITEPASLHYSYTPGRAPTRFLRGLAEGKLLGGRAEGHDAVYPGSRGMDPVAARPTVESVEVGPDATVTAFCIVHIGFGEKAPPTPFVSALILPDGAAASMYGTVLGIPYEEVRIGMRVRPVWVPEEELGLTSENITHWEPTGEPDVPAEQLKGHM